MKDRLFGVFRIVSIMVYIAVFAFCILGGLVGGLINTANLAYCFIPLAVEAVVFIATGNPLFLLIIGGADEP